MRLSAISADTLYIRDELYEHIYGRPRDPMILAADRARWLAIKAEAGTLSTAERAETAALRELI